MAFLADIMPETMDAQLARMLTTLLTARHLDAMNEVAWCYLEGFGTKKDKVSRVLSLIAIAHHIASACSLHVLPRQIASRTYALGRIGRGSGGAILDSPDQVSPETRFVHWPAPSF